MATVVSGFSDGIFDNTVMFKSSGNLTKTIDSTALVLRGTAVRGSAARVYFPTTPGLSATVLVSIKASADNSTFRTIATDPRGALSWASGTEETIVPFEVPSGYPYVKCTFTITGGSTATSYGAVLAGVVPRQLGEWTRVVRWD